MVEVNEAPPRAENTGPVCWHCGCPDLRVYRTSRYMDKIIRQRHCEHCGKRTVTTESASTK